MDKSNEQHMWIALLFLTAIIVTFSFASITNSGNYGTAAIVYDPGDYCIDGTPLNKCSHYSIGNKCIAAKDGAELRFSKKCYEE